MDDECAAGRGQELIHPIFSDEDPCWNGARHIIAIGEVTGPADRIPLCCRHYHALVEAYAAFSIERELGAPDGT